MGIEKNSFHENLRETVKAIIIVNDPKYWKCILLHKELNGKYWLPWWWIEKSEDYREKALKRELTEELFKCLDKNHERDAIISRCKQLEQFDTKRHHVNLYAVKLENKYLKLSNEWKWIWLYPLEDNWWNERKAIEESMEYNAKIAVEKFKNNHKRESYDISALRHWEDDELIWKF